MRMKAVNTRTLITAGLASAMLLAGCSGESTGGTGEPTTGQTVPSSPANSGLPHSGAPKVAEPIDAAAFESDACAILTQQQLKSVGMTLDDTESDPDFAAGPTCDWFLSPVRAGSIHGALLTANPEGLSLTYAKNDAGEWGLFKPTSIAGYPAVIVSRADDRKDGHCNLDIGIRDDLVFSIDVSASFDESPNRKDPCGAAKKLAPLAIETMKGGS